MVDLAVMRASSKRQGPRSPLKTWRVGSEGAMATSHYEALIIARIGPGSSSRPIQPNRKRTKNGSHEDPFPIKRLELTKQRSIVHPALRPPPCGYATPHGPAEHGRLAEPRSVPRQAIAGLARAPPVVDSLRQGSDAGALPTIQDFSVVENACGQKSIAAKLTATASETARQHSNSGRLDSSGP